MLNSTATQRGKSLDRKRILGLFFLACLLALGVGLGLGLGVPYHEAPPSTTFVTTTPVMTTTTPMTTAPVTPCNSSYELPMDNSTFFYWGTLASYYSAAASFRYFTENNPNISLVSIDKATNTILWQHSPCAFVSGNLQNVNVDQSNGDTFFGYRCNDAFSSTFFDRYDKDGNLIWRQNITNLNNTVFSAFQTPVVIDSGKGQIYIGFSDQFSLNGICALRISNGGTVWCTHGASDRLSGLTYSSVTNSLYAFTDSFPPPNFLQQFNTTNGILVTMVDIHNKRLISIATDPSGNIYALSTFSNSSSVHLPIVIKYDASLTLIWQTIFGDSSQTYNQNSAGTVQVLYDTIANILLVGGDVTPLSADSNQIWIATVDPVSGSVGVLYQQTPVSGTYSYYPMLTPDYASQTVFFAYILYNGSYIFEYTQLDTFCYNSTIVPTSGTTTAAPITCPPINPTCNATYSFPIDVGSTDSSVGNFVSYDVCNDILVYFRNDAKLIGQSKQNGSIIWQKPLCTNSEAHLSGQSLYITIDQNVYFGYQCYYTGGLMLEKYNIMDGTLLWSIEIDNYNGLFTAPIATDAGNGRVYVTRLGGGYNIATAHRSVDGSQIWQNFYSSAAGSDRGTALAFDPVGQWLYIATCIPSLDCTIYQLEALGGSTIRTSTGFKNIESFATDDSGYLYVYGNVNNLPYVLKYDDALTQIWNMSIAISNVDFPGYTTILYDPLSKLLIVSGVTATNPFPWFATIHSNNGTTASLSQLPMIAHPTVYVSLVPFFAARSVIYGLYTDNMGSENTTAKTFCY